MTPHAHDADLSGDTGESVAHRRERRPTAPPHREGDPPVVGHAWTIRRAFEPLYAILWRLAVTVALPWAVSGVVKWSKLPQTVLDLAHRVDTVETKLQARQLEQDTIRQEMRGIKTAVCLNLPRREDRINAECPTFVEDIISERGRVP